MPAGNSSVFRSKRTLKGVFLRHDKYTAEMETQLLPIPKLVKLPMLQHMGKPCEPLVKPGDQVRVGNKIGDSKEPFSVPIHASVSGTVRAEERYTAVGGAVIPMVTIEADGKQELSDAICPPKVEDRESFLAAVRESGLAGLGGAGFPAYVKLGYKDPDRLHTLIVNAAECEPYITSDYRECLEASGDIIEGIRAVKRWLGLQRAYIGIERDKPKAVRQLGELCEKEEGIQVVSLPAKYPQGAEKVLIYTTAGIVVEEGNLPADHGVLVMNVSSVAFLARYLKTGMPLVSRRVTVDGTAVDFPKNLEVPLGTPVRELLSYCKVEEERVKMLLMGGPMMGVCIYNMDTPVIKNNNAILAFTEDSVKTPPITACIRCGKCAAVCPVGLMPAALEKAYDSKNEDALKAMSVNLCMNCGCCSYVCPAKRNLAQKNQLAKAFLKKMAQKETSR